MKTFTASMSALMANTYALYLKTQSYHWHVKGVHFVSLHELFETQYQELAGAVDEIAERIRMRGYNVPDSFKQLDKLKTLNDADPNAAADIMLHDLAADHQRIIEEIGEVMKVAEHVEDDGTMSLLSDRILAHEKAVWVLQSSQ